MGRAALLLTALTWNAAALAAEVTLPGKAVIGSESRGIAMAFGCSLPAPRNAVGVLSIGVGVPDFQSLGTRFDFDAFEGPSGTREPLTEITVAQGMRFPAAGHVAVDGTSFHFAVNASMRGETAQLGKVRALADAASAGPGTLRWRQASPRKGDVPILVTVPIAAADADRLKAALAPCLEGQ